MTGASQKEIKESIEQLTNYKNRLKEQVISISKKLRMPSNRINSIIENNQELNQINDILSKLNEQISFKHSKDKR
tara:strand:+ start:121 stop:345 length:225 start_codon:yes stop_codon:yes gene_type:complete